MGKQHGFTAFVVRMVPWLLGFASCMCMNVRLFFSVVTFAGGYSPGRMGVCTGGQKRNMDPRI